MTHSRAHAGNGIGALPFAWTFPARFTIREKEREQ